jgi:NAD-dependent deacetylase
MAGNSPETVIEIHGTVRKVICLGCSYRVSMSKVLERLRAGEMDPDCPDCGGILKSATISFGQSLVPEDLARAESAVQQCDLLLAVGSTLSVYPVAALVPLAHEHGAQVVIVNATVTEMDHLANASLLGEIGELLPRIC